jgi:hypothetical protein
MTKKPREPVDPTDTSHPLYDPARDPTHPFFEGNMTEAEQKPNPSDEDTYKVGPGRPPKQYTWKKGGPSPYPKGRPRKIPSMKPDLKKALETALNEKVVITKDKKEIVMTKAALGIQQLVNQYAKGDRYARRDLFQYAALLGVDLQARDVIAEALGINQQAIVDAAFLRRQQQPSPEPAPEDHVKAPPELIDDDVTQPKPDASGKPGAVPANPVLLPQKPKPELDQYGNPKPRDAKFFQQEREWNLARQKKIQEGS